MKDVFISSRRSQLRARRHTKHRHTLQPEQGAKLCGEFDDVRFDIAICALLGLQCVCGREIVFFVNFQFVPNFLFFMEVNLTSSIYLL